MRHGTQGLQVTKVAVVNVGEDPEEAGEHFGCVFFDKVLGELLVVGLWKDSVVLDLFIHPVKQQGDVHRCWHCRRSLQKKTSHTLILQNLLKGKQSFSHKPKYLVNRILCVLP